ncbi:hypothetical protein [Collimonas sp.]|uniref:hypothetical protein n=1 Tax=Collimonas sp. TaxID=1963772 RepID=UPI002C1456A2|nr:hypothetical protein [Collimonas sp.]HWW06519.1 hypothetical protein [Collimonas sp.]
MSKLSLIAFVLLALNMNTIFAAENDSVSPLYNAQGGPMPQMEVGKVKNISKRKLSSGVRQLVDEDMNKMRGGYAEISDEAFIYRDTYRDRLRNEDEIKPNLRITLADIKNTELKEYAYEGIIPDGPTVAGPWTSVIRVFKRQDGVLLMLSEWDYVADGGGIVTVSELMNVKVKGAPAMLSIKKSPSGNVMTELAWATKKKYFTITVWDDIGSQQNAKKYDEAWLLNLAKTLP